MISLIISSVSFLLFLLEESYLGSLTKLSIKERSLSFSIFLSILDNFSLCSLIYFLTVFLHLPVSLAICLLDFPSTNNFNSISAFSFNLTIHYFTIHNK